MLEYRIPLPKMSQIGTYGKLSSAYLCLCVVYKAIGRAANYIGALLSIGLDYSAYRSGYINLDCFGYRTG